MLQMRRLVFVAMVVSAIVATAVPAFAGSNWW